MSVDMPPLKRKAMMNMKPLKLLDRTLETLTALCFIGIIVVVTIQILTRFLPFSAVWTEELTRFLFIYAVAFGAPVAMKRHEFISIDFIYNIMSERVSKYYQAFTSLVVVAASFFIAYHGYTFMQVGQGQTSATMAIDMSWIHASIGLSMLFIGFYAFINAYEFIFSKRKRGEQE
ncbi:TRAP transporter small permease [Bacillus shivajii]|uniref:TRAP transporter small permease n=1 Tax=Bacillus shivajii TaxID=1983719 RepID=UPI001CF9B91C|nr:TRAP transporter small permease [Bacillus shivajii]UCZ53863.1 TRAP transporter small permease [Bacillus shivajii]